MNSEKKYVCVNGKLILVSDEVYYTYYKMRRQEKTLTEKDARNRLIHYDAWDDGVSNGRDILVDSVSPPPEEAVIASMAREKLKDCLAQLSDGERDLIHALFFEGKTAAALSKQLKIPYRTLGYRRDRILRRLKLLMER